MYVLLFGAFLAIGIWLVVTGTRRGRQLRLWLGGISMASVVALIAVMAFVAELLWYEALGFDGRFWTFTWMRVGAVAAGALVAAVSPLILLRRAGRHLKWSVAGLAAAGCRARVGGGPAGAAAAVYAARKGIRTGVVAERFGGQVLDTLAIENLISVPHTEGPKLARALEQHVKEYDVDIMNLQRAEALFSCR